MLAAHATKRGFGITIYGDYRDLRSLHKTVHELCGSWINDLDAQRESTLSIAYELRKAYEGNREIIKDEVARTTYFSTNIDWPGILFYSSYLRYRAGFCPTSKENQANLYRLEFCIEKALLEYDYKTGVDVLEQSRTIGMVSDNFIASYASEITYEYLYGGGSGKINFRRLPRLLNKFHEWSDEYREFSEYMKSQAIVNNCEINQLYNNRDWPDIKW